jgi:hypothetical protein
MTLAPNQTLTRTLTQKIPGRIPAGSYTYTAKVGTFSSTVTSSDSFTFDKSGTN